MSMLRDAVEKQKEEIIKELIKSGMIPYSDQSVFSLTLSELEWMRVHLHDDQSLQR